MDETRRSAGGVRTPARLLLPALLAIAGMALSAGCASIPTSGPVRSGPEIAAADDSEQAVQVLPQPPIPGAAPEQIVSGFLAASGSFDDGHATARLFLAPEVAQRWRPEPRVVVYDGSVFKPTVAPGDVTVATRQVASIDAEGRYTELASGRDVSARFDVRRIDGEWRISALEDGLYLTAAVIPRAYRQLNLYFLTPDRSTVVPDPVLLPQRQGLPTALTERLLDGPTTDLRPAVSTAFPPGTELAISSVTVENGVAQVDLDDVVLGADGAARQAMSAQLVWTLRQLREVRAVQLTVQGERLSVPGVGSGDQGSDAWPSYDPDALISSAAFLVRDGQLGQMGADNDFTPVPGPLGDGSQALRFPAISAEAGRVAMLSPDRRTLHVGWLRDGEALEPRLTGGLLGRPSWGPDGGVWVADGATGVVYRLPPDEEPSVVALPDLRGALVHSVRLARDGVRAAVLARRDNRDEVYIGVVVRSQGGPPGIAALHRIAPGLLEVRDISWASADRVVVLGREADGVVQPTLVDVDGYEKSPTTPLTDAVSISAAPGQPMLTATVAEQVFQASGRQWRPVGAGTDPVYPG